MIDKPETGQPAYEIFSIKRRFWQFKFWPLRFKKSSTYGVKFGYPFKMLDFCYHPLTYHKNGCR